MSTAKKISVAKRVTTVLTAVTVLACTTNVYADSLEECHAATVATQKAADEARAKADAAQAAYEALVNENTAAAASVPNTTSVAAAGTVAQTAAAQTTSPVAPQATATAYNSNDGMVTVNADADPVIGLWVADIAKNIPKPLWKTFKAHHGHITIVSAGHKYGGVTTLVFTNDKISMSDPVQMQINSDYIYGSAPDYLYHEFGHVFDAATGMTNDMGNRAIIMGEMPALAAATATEYPNGSPFTTVQEAAAEVYMAKIGAKTGEITYAQAILNACPNTSAMIDRYSALLK